MAPQDTRRGILNAAAAEFLEHGFAAASMAAIAARLGLTKGALTHHFPAKADLAHGMLAEAFITLDRAYQQSEEVVPEPGLGRLLDFHLRMGIEATQSPMMVAAVVLYADRSSPVYQFEPLLVRWMDLLESDVQASYDKGEITSATSVRDAAEFLLTQMMGAVVLRTRRPKRDSSDRLRSLKFGMRGIGVINAEEMVDSAIARARLGHYMPDHLGAITQQAWNDQDRAPSAFDAASAHTPR